MTAADVPVNLSTIPPIQTIIGGWNGVTIGNSRPQAISSRVSYIAVGNTTIASSTGSNSASPRTPRARLRVPESS